MNWQRRIRRWSTIAITLGLISALTGCEFAREHTLTGNLWNSDMGVNYREPATPVDLRLVQTEDGKDLVVLYWETTEWSAKTNRRAYLLYKSAPLLEARKKPQFINVRKAEKLQPIPILVASETNDVMFSSSISTNAPVYAISSPNGHLFMLVSGKTRQEYYLPVYIPTWSHTARVAMTPLTATGDIIIYSTIVGVIAAYFWAQGGAPH